MNCQETPRLVPVGGGSSILNTVLYRERFLYSKYNPSRAIETAVQKAVILPGTLILLNSPALFYGLQELLQKCPDDCMILALESEAPLLELSQNTLSSFNSEVQQRVKLMNAADTLSIDSFLRRAVSTGKIKRCLCMDFSAGTQFNSGLYKKIFDAAQEITAAFWKNRITIVRMGRLFARNILQNLARTSAGLTLDCVKHSVDRPIIVCGAGESLDSFFTDGGSVLRELVQSRKCFLLAVDAAFPALLERGIDPDGVVAVESQWAIQKAYIGTKKSRAAVFADLCSRPQVASLARNRNVRTIWFTSWYADTCYLESLRNMRILPAVLPPLGSVGLTATALALALRKTQETPVFVTGLDFSYSVGKTHASGTPQHKAMLFTQTRLSSIGNYGASFNGQAHAVKSKDGAVMISPPALEGYAALFRNFFCGTQALFDAGKSGIPLGLPELSVQELCTLIEKHADSSPQEFVNKLNQQPLGNKACDFVLKELKTLEQISSLLSYGKESPYYQENSDLSATLATLIQPRDYLYIHFPDGYAFSTDISFLTRVSAEVKYFAKCIRVSLGIQKP